MNTNYIPTPPEPTEAEIQHTAYLLWLESDRAPNRELEHWLSAKELLRHRHAPANDHRHRVISPIPPPIPPAPPAAARLGRGKPTLVKA
jgi:hypothetical protein